MWRLCRQAVVSTAALVQNQNLFKKLGFITVAETMHPGFDRVTSLTLRKSLTLEDNHHGA